MLRKMASGPDRAAANALTRSLSMVVAGSLLVAIFAYACVAGTSGDCGEKGTCAPVGGDGATEPSAIPDDGATADGDGPVDSAGGEPAGGEGSADAGDATAEGDAAPANLCDAGGSPSQNPCAISDLYGVFVSPGGDDNGGLGTHASPVKTIGRAMDLARPLAKKNVYVCAGTFRENILVSLMRRDGVSVYGGIDCATATYGAANKAVVAPLAGYALEVHGTAATVWFEDIEFDAPDASPSSPGASSIAVFVESSQGVTLRRVTIVAGNATDGIAGLSGGSSGNPSNLLMSSSLDGNSAVDASGAPSKNCVCPDGATSSTGGQGGASAVLLDGGQAPGAGLPSYGGDAGAGDPGINGVSCGAGGSAQNGADAPAGAADAPSASWGALSFAGWAPGVGAPASNGKPGQGGGGGGYGTVSASTGSGGGGACGGCGGAGGKPGGGGGSSIALLSYQSPVVLLGCTLTAHGAGKGGAGGNGEPGQAGGIAGVQFRSGCPGGGGGTGAGGNGAQGGPGGLSVGILYSGPPPVFDGISVSMGTSSSIIPGQKGAPGPSGTAAPADAGPKGADGPPAQDGVVQGVIAF